MQNAFYDIFGENKAIEILHFDWWRQNNIL